MNNKNTSNFLPPDKNTRDKKNLTKVNNSFVNYFTKVNNSVVNYFTKYTINTMNTINPSILQVIGLTSPPRATATLTQKKVNTDNANILLHLAKIFNHVSGSERPL
ncbi:MAG: hypothetical protein WD512_20465, partial [Candidatus Paceibacterota bacterium]